MRSQAYKPYKMQSKHRYKFTPKPQQKEVLWKTKRMSSSSHNLHSPETPVGRKTGRRRISSISKRWLDKPPVVKRGEREICNPLTPEGRAEYRYRLLLMWVRQDGWCCFRDYDFCPGRLRLAEATFEHENKRTRGERDDRISYFDESGKERPQNGAAHGECNRIAGSRRLKIWHGTNWLVEVEKVSA